MKKELYEEIVRAIEQEAMKTGRMGTESVTINMYLTAEEKEDFLNHSEDFDEDHYFWEFDNYFPDRLWMTYTEEI